ncbi:kinase-like domain-containing protein [Whalleya microplaca]|nr:kinase-like domain-containing protein [Whalleya microplaca]
MFTSTDSDLPPPGSFVARRYFSKIVEPRAHASRSRYDLISVLSAAQGVKTDLLPITWQAARAAIGKGGTAQINQRLLNLQMSFAFKCVKDEEKETKNESDILEQVISEILILGSTDIQQHPNIVKLEGVCWDIGADRKVWPALVFEKSHYGNLEEFARLSPGRELQRQDRVKLCVDIATAVSDMHSHGIIHGDIKPLNVLVFRTADNAYTARVTDFGYSRRFASEDSQFTLPTSWPWSAPEHDRSQRKFNKCQARKTDIFSLGMLFLWFLFRDFLSGETALPSTSDWAQEFIVASDNAQLVEFASLDNLKYAGKLSVLSRQLIEADESFEGYKKSELGELLRLSLQNDPETRDTNIGGLLDRLAPDRYRQPNKRFESTSREPEYPQFSISASIGQLYRADYRLRSYVVDCFQNRLQGPDLYGISGSSKENTVQQIYLCAEVGFGGAEVDSLFQIDQEQNRKMQAYIEDTLRQWKNIRPKPFKESISREQVQRGSFPRLDSGDHYRVQDCLEEAITKIQEEARRLEQRLGSDNIMIYTIKTALASMFRAQSRMNEAERWAQQALETSEAIHGEGHENSLITMGNLATIFQAQNKLTEAEKLLKKQMVMENELFGKDDIDLLGTIANLGLVYRDQQRLDDAEGILHSVMQRRIRVQGKEHEDSLTAIMNLASTYTLLDKLDKAERLERYVFATRQRVLGVDHPDTLTVANNLLVTYIYQSKWPQAVELGKHVLQAKRRVFGHQDPSTLQTMSYLSQACDHVRSPDLMSHTPLEAEGTMS